MTRGLVLVVTLVALVVVGALTMLQNRGQGPSSPSTQRVEAQALATASTAEFAPVAQVLELAYSQTGTYAGAALPGGTGVTVVNASATGYCLQADLSGSVVHENGPGGSPAAGPCA